MAVVEMIKGIEHWRDRKGDWKAIQNIKDEDKLEDSSVADMVKKAKEKSKEIKDFQIDSLNEVYAFYEVVAEKYGVKKVDFSSAKSLTMISFDGKQKVQVSIQDKIELKDTKMNIAKIKINEALDEISNGENSTLLSIVRGAFDMDNKGNMSVKKLLALRNVETENAKWLEGMNIIHESIMIVGSKSYVRFYEKRESDNKWEQISFRM